VATRPDVVGWQFDGKEFELQRPKTVQGVDVWATVLPFLPLPIAIYRDEDGEVRGFRIRFMFKGRDPRDIDLPARIVRDREPARVIADAGGPDITTDHAKIVVRLLGDVIAGKGRRIKDVAVLTRARWDGDVLHVPGPEVVIPSMPELAKYGVRADCTEDEARSAWRTVVEVAESNPRFAATVGFTLGAMYTQQQELSVFLLSIRGDSGFGKTEGAECAMNELGRARPPGGALYRTWNNSAQAIGNTVRALGILPLWLDETATFKGKDDEFEALVFELAQGRSRAVANTSFGLVDGSDARWFSCVISTGERGLVSTSDLGGMRRRVLEFPAPLVEHRVGDWDRPEFAHDAAVAASRRAYGWPLWWLAEDPDPGGFKKVRTAIGDALLDVINRQEAESRIAFHETDNIATVLSGFVVLGRLVDEDVLERAKEHAVALFNDLRYRYAEEGTTVAQKAVAGIRNSIMAAPDRWPDHADELIARDRFGVTWKEFPNEIGIIDKETFRLWRLDPNIALQDLRRTDLLVLEGSREGFKTRRPIWQAHRGGIVRDYLYVVRLPEDEGNDGQAEGNARAR